MDVYNLPLEQRVLGPILAARAKSEGERPYLTCGGRTWSFRETGAVVRDHARGLRELGVAKGDMVAMLLPNGAEFVFSWYAICLAGAVMVPINPEYKGYMLDYVLGDCRAKGLVVDRSLAGALSTLATESLQRLDWVAVVGGRDGLDLPAGPKRYLDYRDASRSGSGDPEVRSDFRDLQCVMYTSGTTGPSKGVMIPNGHFFSSSMTFLRALALTRDDILFTPLPLFHGLASRLGVLPALMTGTHVVIVDRFHASRFWQQVTECKATVGHTIFSIPPILKAQPPGPYDTAHCLRAMYNANYDAEFEQRFRVPLVEAYGVTETGLTIYTPWPERRAGSCGRAHEDYEIAIVDEYDRPLPDGEVGEVLVRPKRPFITMAGYLNKEAETLRVMRNLWYHSGDYARRDADGYFFFSGRMKERIRRRGENISGFEVERIVCNHPEIGECAAVAHPAPGGEDDVRCVIVRRAGSTLTEAALMDWLVPRMPHFMVPRYVEFVERMPMTPSQKVEKYKLVADGLGPTAWDREVAGYKVERQPK
jgi:crotonobetaine/carnitine-CoA ligase